MLKTLTIKNYILIDTINLEFCKGLNIISGETGAGKSIILGALGLILGQRADTKSLFDSSKKCVIEGILDIKNYNLQEFFLLNDLDYDDEVIIRREIYPSGKTRAFINDTPANLNQLSELSSSLIDMHEQMDRLQIRHPAYQLSMVDIIADNDDLLAEYSKMFQKYKGNLEKIKTLKEDILVARKEYEFNQFQLNELEKVNIQPKEIEQLELKVNQLENLEEIKLALSEGIQFLEGGEHNIISQMRTIARNLRNLNSLDPVLDQSLTRIDQNISELVDLQSEFESLFASYSEQEHNLDEINARMDILNRLASKHQAKTTDELLAYMESLYTDSQQYENLDQDISALESEVHKQQQLLLKYSKELCLKRKEAIPVIEDKVGKLLSMLAMKNAVFKIQIINEDQLNPTGMDRVEFLIAANKGSELMPLKKVASGGEISRFNLSLKSMIAKKVKLPTLIFDEIDTGISGEIAMQMGAILSDLADNHQIISITHSPQVAAKANKHFLVYKRDDKHKTWSKIKTLDLDQRILEIAKMLSGDPPNASAIENAKELIRL